MDDSETGLAMRAIGPLTRPDSPSIGVARHLVQFLLSGQFVRGDRIPSERQLADALNVGRASIREATKSLSLLGLLSIRQGDGTYLAESASSLLPEVIGWGLMLDQRSLGDLVEARINLEAFASGLAAERATPEQLEELRLHQDRMQSSLNDPATFAQADVDFHVQIARMSGNEVLLNITTSLGSLLRVWGNRIAETSADLASLASEHLPIVLGIAERDRLAAQAAMEVHSRLASSRLIAVVNGASNH